MTTDRSGPPALERLLARVLYVGTWLASVIIAIGIALVLIDSRAGMPRASIEPDMRVVTAGIVLFILLPVIRVTLMLVAFLRRRDFGLSAIAALVLLFISLGFVVGRV